jgi:hypothetical protein
MTTRALLLCGAIAGPMYVAVTLVQALTRDGFDMKEHRFTLLTAGELGWIHQLNMVLVGLLSVVLAIGVRRTMRTGRGAIWAPRLLALFGLAYVVGGLLTSDPVVGFPVGTTGEMVQKTWQGAVQNASRGVSTLLLIATSLVVSARFAAEGRRFWAWLYPAAIPLVFVALAIVGRAVGVNPAAPAFLAMPWIWVSLLAVHLYRLEATSGSEDPAGERMRAATRAGGGL